MIRFLHTSDWQLGMTRHLLTEGAQGRYSQSHFDAIAVLAKNTYIWIRGPVRKCKSWPLRLPRAACLAPKCGPKMLWEGQTSLIRQL
jgi:hypothetical protein